jgi:N-acetyl-gamma-glutamyl-phosphate reductase
MADKAKIGVLGASGYTGAELLRLLLPHPRVEIALLTAERRAGQHMRQVFPQFSPYALPKLVAIDGVDWNKAALDLAFCALPHATTQTVIKDLLAKAPTTKVVDLSADFRLGDTAAYARWYGHEHHAPDLQKEAVYGLAEIYRHKIKTARLVANPGCYTTCAELPLIPLLRAKAIDPDEIVIDAKSGMTGAGRAAKEEMLFSEVSEGFHPYGVGHHRHMAELDQEFSKATGRNVIVSFTPHLVPMNRGILSTIYAPRPACDPVEVLRGGAVRACPAVRRNAANPPCARLQHDVHRGCERPGRRPRHHLLGARQPCQGRLRPGRAEHEPHARLSRDAGARAGGAVSVMS